MHLLIIEDESILAEKYQQYLSPLFNEVTVCSDFQSAKKTLATQDVEVCLVDYHLPDGNGLDIVKTLAQDPDAPVIVMITAYSKERIAIESLNLGVSRYLEKPIEKNELVSIIQDSINLAIKRESLRILEKKFLVNQQTKRILKDDYLLSHREIEVLEKFLIHGKNKTIGKVLFISEGTIRNHLSNIYQKLHLTSKDELRTLIEKLNQNAALADKY